MAVLWPNGTDKPGDVWHEYGPRPPIWTPNGPTSSFHSGIDIGPWDGTYSTWLLAPVVGTVTHAGYDDIFGNRVVVSAKIDGDQVEFSLCHGRPGSMQVRAGDRVNQKQRLQLMGETGKASGVHVHFEVHVNGVRVDPRAFYNQPHSGGGASPIQSEEDDMPIMVKANVNIYVLSPGQIKLADETRQVQAMLDAGVRQHDLSGTTAQQNQAFADLLDMFGIPRIIGGKNLLDGNGHVLNPENGKYEKNGMWSWDRAARATK